MGFRRDAYAMCWEVKPVTDTVTNIRISINRKNRNTGEYEQDFSGFVDCVGSAVAKKALTLKRGDRIRLGNVDVSTSYNKEAHKSYTNLKVFSFDIVSQDTTGSSVAQNDEVDDSDDPEEELLPF